ncbi:hypothetical protein A6R68_17611 [Neotoma lepida]|uniref:Ly49-like N-terminal domain-containing protein n=1 Tax=Neotoma lepida TaxID=56216 RepID=A0A1A6HCC5_NEOLE|nr:hypothetical protein A6R68_17611 [Neotoma lepida]
MSDEEITYATVRFHKSSSELENGGRSDETHGPREAGHRIFQYKQEKHEQKKILNNLYQEYNTMKNNNSLNEQMWRNKTIEYDALKDRLDSLNREWNRCYGETKIVLDCMQRAGKRVEGHWFCCGIKCYYFIEDEKRWSRCKQTCQSCSLSLLKIENKDELVP